MYSGLSYLSLILILSLIKNLNGVLLDSRMILSLHTIPLTFHFVGHQTIYVTNIFFKMETLLLGTSQLRSVPVLTRNIMGVRFLVNTFISILRFYFTTVFFWTNNSTKANLIRWYL